MVLQRDLALSTSTVGASTQLAEVLSSESLRSEVPSTEVICMSERGVCWTSPDFAKRPVKHPVKRGPEEGMLPLAPYTQTRKSTNACHVHIQESLAAVLIEVGLMTAERLVNLYVCMQAMSREATYMLLHCIQT